MTRNQAIYALMESGFAPHRALQAVTEAEQGKPRPHAGTHACKLVKYDPYSFSRESAYTIEGADAVGCPHDPGEGHSPAGYAANH